MIHNMVGAVIGVGIVMIIKMIMGVKNDRKDSRDHSRLF